MGIEAGEVGQEGVIDGLDEIRLFEECVDGVVDVAYVSRLDFVALVAKFVSTDERNGRSPDGCRRCSVYGPVRGRDIRKEKHFMSRIGLFVG